MSNSLADQYYLRALEQYPWSPNEVIIALGYALSYDDCHPQAHCLMGRLLMEHVKDFQQAAHHFEISMLFGPNFVDTYKYYSLLLIWLGEFDKAEVIIRRGMNVPGISRSSLNRNRSVLYELQGRLDLARRTLRMALQSETSLEGQLRLETELERLNRKVKRLNNVDVTPEESFDPLLI